MKRTFLFIYLFCIMIAASFSQEKKAFTLNDVIPGGSNYFNLIPQNMPGLQWWGDICIRTDVEDIKTIDVKTGKETVLLTLKEVNDALQNGEKPYKLSHPVKPLRSLQGASLPWEKQKIVKFSGKV